MTRRPSMFGPSSRLRPGSSQSSSSSVEIDLRAEMDNILFGENGGPRHGRLVLLRNFRRDSDGYKTQCTCLQNQTTRESDPDCSYCDGEGYLFDENWAWSFDMYAGADSGFVRRYIHIPAGYTRTDYKIFFFRYNTHILDGDKIVEVRLDAEGEPEVPYIREAIHEPGTIQKRRLDNGRIEFVAAFCKESDALRSDNPQ